MTSCFPPGRCDIDHADLEAWRAALWLVQGLDVSRLPHDEVLRQSGWITDGSTASGAIRTGGDSELTRKSWRLPLATVEQAPEPAPAPPPKQSAAPAPPEPPPEADFEGVDAEAQAAVFEQAAAAGTPLCGT